MDGTEISGMTEEQLTIFRRRKIGFVFQDCALVPELTVRENILFPMALDHMRPDWAYFSELPGLLGLRKAGFVPRRRSQAEPRSVRQSRGH